MKLKVQAFYKTIIMFHLLTYKANIQQTLKLDQSNKILSQNYQ